MWLPFIKSRVRTITDVKYVEESKIVEISYENGSARIDMSDVTNIEFKIRQRPFRYLKKYSDLD